MHRATVHDIVHGVVCRGILCLVLYVVYVIIDGCIIWVVFGCVTVFVVVVLRCCVFDGVLCVVFHGILYLILCAVDCLL